ncbi:hypothetical protein HN371_00225 [Candidatus Poribacteria bacterium]|jgi:hypothetical protein|nr:hypothetical protein [Candidatus Poribacteria bacterium]MBT7096610.1 hypothetical protein [Candidatus Poribacteria bacterium]
MTAANLPRPPGITSAEVRDAHDLQAAVTELCRLIRMEGVFDGLRWAARGGEMASEHDLNIRYLRVHNARMGAEGQALRFIREAGKA